MSHQFPWTIAQRVRSPLQACVCALAILAHGVSSAQDTSATNDPPPPPPMPEAAAPTPSPALRYLEDKPLGSLKASIKPSDGDVPGNPAGPKMAVNGIIPQSLGDGRPWMFSSVEWEAPATKHLPLLFEEPNLERLGYAYGCRRYPGRYQEVPCGADCLQPLVSGAHFFGRIPFIPYMYGYQCACKPVYTLGVDRPGSPVPYRTHRIPISLKGALYEAGFLTGLIFYIP